MISKGHVLKSRVDTLKTVGVFWILAISRSFWGGVPVSFLSIADFLHLYLDTPLNYQRIKYLPNGPSNHKNNKTKALIWSLQIMYKISGWTEINAQNPRRPFF